MSYQSTILDDSPLRYYRGSVTDLGSQAVDGTLSGATTSGAGGLLPGGDVQASILYNGGKMTAPGTGLPSGNSAWSVETWIKPTSIASSITIMEFGGDSGMYLFAASSVCTVQIGVVNHSSAFTLVDGTVYYLCATYDGAGTLVLYLGDTSGTFHTFSLATGLTLSLGSGLLFIASDNFSEPYYGNAQESALYGTALSSTQATAHWNAGISPALSVSAAGVGLLTATVSLSGTVALAVAMSGAGTLAGTLALSTALSAALAGAGALSGVWSIRVALSLTCAGVGTLSGVVSLRTALFLTCAGVGTLTGQLAILGGLAGTLAGVGVLSGTINFPGPSQTATWVTRDHRATWVTRDDKTTWKTKR